MTLDEASAFLARSGHDLSSLSRIAPEMGYIATSRKIGKGADSGTAGFGATAQLALDRLIEEHGGPKATKPVTVAPADDLADLLG